MEVYSVILFYGVAHATQQQPRRLGSRDVA